MDTYLTIQNEINNLKDVHEDYNDQINKLHKQMIVAQNSYFSREDLSEYLKSEDDVCDKIDNEALIEEVRNIQDLIICFYSDFPR